MPYGFLDIAITPSVRAAQAKMGADRIWQNFTMPRGRHRHRRRLACINDLPIAEAERKFDWPLGRRPDDVGELTSLGL